MVTATFSNGYALLIGVGADLPMTVRDATALWGVLTDPDRAAYPPEQVELLSESRATRQDILDAFDRLIERVNSNHDATVIVYFSGHGGRVARNDRPAAYFLVPYGYDPGRFSSTAISGLEFTAKIEAIRARKLVVLLDCCHAAGVPVLKEPGYAFVKSPVPPALLDVLESGSGLVVIASSHEGEYSYTGAHYSIFTSCLLEALTGRGAVQKDGFARVLDILIYLFEHVPKRASGPQHPFVKKVLDLGDNFPLCYYAGGSKTVTDPVLDSETVLTGTGLTTKQRHRLGQRAKILEQDWDLRTKKVQRMRTALAIETDIAARFKLEQQLLDEEVALANIGNELNGIEQLLL